MPSTPACAREQLDPGRFSTFTPTQCDLQKAALTAATGRPVLQTRGGAGGTDADLTDLQWAGTQIKTVGTGIMDIGTKMAADIASVTGSADALVNPTALRVLGATGQITLTAATLGAGMVELGKATLAAKSAYELTDAIQSHGMTDFVLNGGLRGWLVRRGEQGAISVRGLRLRLGAGPLNGDPVPTDWLDASDYAPIDGQGTKEMMGVLWPLLDVARMTGTDPGAVLKDRKVALGDPTPVRSPNRPATSVKDLVGQTSIQVSPEDRDEKARHGVRMNRLKRPDGTFAWVVVLPGTADVTGSNPETVRNMESNLAAMVKKEPTQHMLAIQAALRRQMKEVGADPSKEPVMLVGHSQGGILAARLSNDPGFRKEFQVRSVLTSGAPIRDIVSHDVQTLALEHDEDPTPNLDSGENRDQANLTTMKRSLVSSPLPNAAEKATLGKLGNQGFHQTHTLPAYLDTAAQVDRESNASLERWRQESAEFTDATSQQSWVVDMAPAPEGSPPPK